MSKNNLPVILLKGLVLLPLGEARIELNNNVTRKVIDLSKQYYDNYVLVSSPLNSLEEAPSSSDISKVAILAKITSRIDLPSGITKIVLSASKRVKVINYISNVDNKDILEANFIDIPRYDYNQIEEEALSRKLVEVLEIYISKNPYVSNSILSIIRRTKDLEALTDYVANFVPLSIDKKLIFMNEENRIIRAKKLISELNIEISILDLEGKLDNELKEDLDNMQKEMILKEKIKIIKKELGSKDTKSDYIDSVKEKIINLPSNIQDRINIEINRYENTLENSPELSTIRAYIDTVLSIPFGVYSEEVVDLELVKRNLDDSHYGLNEVKERILEYVAVRMNSTTSPVICLIGPPGVGKTTLSEKIASSLNKKFAKISLGGISDPSELTGHRKTYIGSEPGKIISSVIKSGCMNPVILLDEIDKMGQDYKGDPSNVLLDLLDNNQNKSYVDNYIEEKVDLSKVTFILTANDKSQIPLVLLDRLEIIEINSYLEFEKIKIAENYLIKNACRENGITSNDIIFETYSIKLLIEKYTKEAGVRELERLINKIIRKIITEKKLKHDEVSRVVITKELVYKYLGSPKYENKSFRSRNLIGYTRGLAYTPLGGDVIEIEVTGYEGKEEFITSGHLGDTLKESISVAMGFIKANKEYFKYPKNNKTMHINFREGGVPKEGPSAGTVITTAILSYLLHKEIPLNVSSSGEITLLGDILPVGGLREKSLAAIKNNITKIYLSKENKKDIEELPKEIKNKINFIFVSNYKEIYEDIFK